MIQSRRAGILPALTWLCAFASAAHGEPADSTRVVENDAKYGMVVSATRTPRPETEVPAGTAVIRGETLRKRGVQTVAEALQDVTGLDAEGGSDNGSRLPNIGVWGLKEFDALLVCVDGVPIGGPFNPALEQIPVDDVDRIEIVKGPQGTLYGVSAFAGMIQIFTRPTGEGAAFTERVSSFGGNAGDLSWNGRTPDGTRVRVSGSAERADGWQDCTAFSRFRSTLGLSRGLGRAQVGLNLTGFDDRQQWAAPLPFDSGSILPGFAIDRNTAVGGAAADHLFFGATGTVLWPFDDATRAEGTFGIGSDRQKIVRNFVDATSLRADSVDADGQSILPVETTAYADVRAVRTQRLAGPHELVAGAALTWGKLRASIHEFDMSFVYTPVPLVPDVSQRPSPEGGDVETERHFAGLYAHDSWTPHPRVTVGGGVRADFTGEDLETEDPASPGTTIKDTREDTGWSGDGTLLVRLLPEGAARGMVLNLYGGARRTFKPAAPNVTEPEGAKILEPERTRAFEGGLKFRGLDEQVALDFTAFRMDFDNMVVSTLDSGGLPELINAGRTRYAGEEVSLRLAPRALRGLALQGGFAHHDPRFIQFTFVTPDSQLRDVSGKRPELSPLQLWNAGASWQGWKGLSAFVTARGAGESFFNRRNTFTVPSWSEWDAGVALEIGPARWSVTGRNLSNSRHVVAESEIGDSQFYVAPPRRLIAAVTIRM